MASYTDSEFLPNFPLDGDGGSNNDGRAAGGGSSGGSPSQSSTPASRPLSASARSGANAIGGGGNSTAAMHNYNSSYGGGYGYGNGGAGEEGYGDESMYDGDGYDDEDDDDDDFDDEVRIDVGHVARKLNIPVGSIASKIALATAGGSSSSLSAAAAAGGGGATKATDGGGRSLFNRFVGSLGVAPLLSPTRPSANKTPALAASGAGGVEEPLLPSGGSPPLDPSSGSSLPPSGAENRPMRACGVPVRIERAAAAAAGGGGGVGPSSIADGLLITEDVIPSFRVRRSCNYEDNTARNDFYQQQQQYGGGGAAYDAGDSSLPASLRGRRPMVPSSPSPSALSGGGRRGEGGLSPYVGTAASPLYGQAPTFERNGSSSNARGNEGDDAADSHTSDSAVFFSGGDGGGNATPSAASFAAGAGGRASSLLFSSNAGGDQKQPLPKRRGGGAFTLTNNVKQRHFKLIRCDEGNVGGGGGGPADAAPSPNMRASSDVSGGGGAGTFGRANTNNNGGSSYADPLSLPPNDDNVFLRSVSDGGGVGSLPASASSLPAYMAPMSLGASGYGLLHPPQRRQSNLGSAQQSPALGASSAAAAGGGPPPSRRGATYIAVLESKKNRGGGGFFRNSATAEEEEGDAYDAEAAANDALVRRNTHLNTTLLSRSQKRGGGGGGAFAINMPSSGRGQEGEEGSYMSGDAAPDGYSCGSSTPPPAHQQRSPLPSSLGRQPQRGCGCGGSTLSASAPQSLAASFADDRRIVTDDAQCREALRRVAAEYQKKGGSSGGAAMRGSLLFFPPPTPSMGPLQEREDGGGGGVVARPESYSCTASTLGVGSEAAAAASAAAPPPIICDGDDEDPDSVTFLSLTTGRRTGDVFVAMKRASTVVFSPQLGANDGGGSGVASATAGGRALPSPSSLSLQAYGQPISGVDKAALVRSIYNHADKCYDGPVVVTDGAGGEGGDSSSSAAVQYDEFGVRIHHYGEHTVSPTGGLLKKSDGGGGAKKKKASVSAIADGGSGGGPTLRRRANVHFPENVIKKVDFIQQSKSEVVMRVEYNRPPMSYVAAVVALLGQSAAWVMVALCAYAPEAEGGGNETHPNVTTTTITMAAISSSGGSGEAATPFGSVFSGNGGGEDENGAEGWMNAARAVIFALLVSFGSALCLYVFFSLCRGHPTRLEKLSFRHPHHLRKLATSVGSGSLALVLMSVAFAASVSAINIVLFTVMPLVLSYIWHAVKERAVSAVDAGGVLLAIAGASVLIAGEATRSADSTEGADHSSLRRAVAAVAAIAAAFSQTVSWNYEKQSRRYFSNNVVMTLTLFITTGILGAAAALLGVFSEPFGPSTATLGEQSGTTVKWLLGSAGSMSVSLALLHGAAPYFDTLSITGFLSISGVGSLLLYAPLGGEHLPLVAETYRYAGAAIAAIGCVALLVSSFFSRRHVELVFSLPAVGGRGRKGPRPVAPTSAAAPPSGSLGQGQEPPHQSGAPSEAAAGSRHLIASPPPPSNNGPKLAPSQHHGESSPTHNAGGLGEEGDAAPLATAETMPPTPLPTPGHSMRGVAGDSSGRARGDSAGCGSELGEVALVGTASTSAAI